MTKSWISRPADFDLFFKTVACSAPALNKIGQNPNQAFLTFGSRCRSVHKVAAAGRLQVKAMLQHVEDSMNIPTHQLIGTYSMD